MTHQLEISFQYGDEPSGVPARVKLDLLSGLDNVKDAARRNLRERNMRISTQLSEMSVGGSPAQHKAGRAD